MKNLVITMEGGAIAAMYADEPIRVAIVDYDIDGAKHVETIHFTDADAPPEQAELSVWSTNDEGILLDAPWVRAIAAQACQARDAYALRTTGYATLQQAKQAALPGCTAADRAAAAVHDMFAARGHVPDPPTHRVRVSFQLAARYEGGLGDVVEAQLPRRLQPPDLDELIGAINSLALLLDMVPNAPGVRQAVHDARQLTRRCAPFYL